MSIDFAQEKKLFFTGFAHRKATLWKSCEWSFGCSRSVAQGNDQSVRGFVLARELLGSRAKTRLLFGGSVGTSPWLGIRFWLSWHRDCSGPGYALDPIRFADLDETFDLCLRAADLDHDHFLADVNDLALEHFYQ